MRAYIVRRITPEELLYTIAELEAHGRREDAERLLVEYSKYEEEGELTYTVEKEVPVDVARRMLTGRMQKLLELLRQGKDLSVSELARELGRSPSNVYNDLKFLQQHGAVRLEKQGRWTVPRLLMEGLLLELD